jgi:hypothetical protein
MVIIGIKIAIYHNVILTALRHTIFMMYYFVHMGLTGGEYMFGNLMAPVQIEGTDGHYSVNGI